jgi:Cft2 family RNA processing exonuclease
MSPSLTPISGCGAKGPACFLVEAGGARLLLDLGYGPQPGLWPDVSNVGQVDALLVSHSHRDHAGALELTPQVGNPTVYATDIVRGLLPDGTNARSLPLHGSAEVCGVRVSTGRSGHAPGGVWLHLAIGGGLLYMGDCSVESAVYACDPAPPARTIILDASYGAYDTSLADSLPAFDAVFDAGPVLLPVPPAGRGPEIALHIFRSGRGYSHLDDAVRSAIAKLGGENRTCLREDAAADIAAIAKEAPGIDGANGIVLAAVADASSGAAARLASQWEREASPQIVFTGYLPAGTPAARLTQSGRARYLRWNVHPRLSDNARLVRETGARTVLPAFGEARHLRVWQEAFSPAQVALDGPVSL